MSERRCRAKRFRGWFERVGVWNATDGSAGVVVRIHLSCRAGHVTERDLYR